MFPLRDMDLGLAVFNARGRTVSGVINCYKWNCRPILVAQQCVSAKLSTPQCQFPQPLSPVLRAMQKQIALANITINFVCRDHAQGRPMSFIVTLYLFSYLDYE